MSADLSTLINAVCLHGFVVGEVARMYLRPNSPEGGTLEIVPFSTGDAYFIKWILEDRFGYDVDQMPNNDFYLPEVVVLDPTMPMDYLVNTTLYNQAFCLLNSSLGMTTHTAISAEERCAIQVQKWRKETTELAGEFLYQQRPDGIDYHLDILTEITMRDFAGDKETNDVKSGKYQNWRNNE